jgi:hypothetical protein
MSDTPTQRAAINQLSIDQLDEMLTAIRERRLERVQKLEALAHVKADKAQLTSWLAFERSYNIAKRALNKLQEQETKVEELIHKARIKAMVVNFEVTEIEDAAD